MGSRPWNLGFRFILEIAALVGLGWGGHTLGWTGPGALVQSIAPPLAAAVVWGTLAVPDDPSRSGRAPVPVPGWLRLMIELAVFAAGVAGFAVAEATGAAVALGLGVIVHYALSIDRIRWLLARR